jgi:chemotaxis protein methyltransferase CheR
VHGLDVAVRNRLLEPTGDGRWRVRPEISRRIAYDHHDLLGARWPEGAFDLILCRNVLIYLGPDEREGVLGRLAGSLRPGGLLFLSATEVVLDAPAYGLLPLGHALYRRQAAAAGGEGEGWGGDG